MIIRSKRIICENEIVNGYLIVENGKIMGIEPYSTNLKVDLDYSEYRIIPGIFDTHNHGFMGYSLFSDNKEDEKEYIVKGYLRALASAGVTSVFPTCSIDMMETIAKCANENPIGARILGIHSEGPDLNRVGENGIYEGMPTIDLSVYEEMIRLSGGYLKLVGIAPEIEGSEKVIAYLMENGVKVAFAHSNCDYHEAMKAFDKGICVSTHTANVMSGIHHRHMGGLGACLLRDDVQCEIICDFLHISQEMIELMFRVKDYSKWMMISDNVAIAQAPVGRYEGFDGLACTVTEEGFCLSDTGRLMGSTQPVLYGMKNLVEKLKISIVDVCKMSASNPCSFYGVSNKGSLTVGKDADFVVIDDDYRTLVTYREGLKIYDSKEDTDLLNQSYFESVKISD